MSADWAAAVGDFLAGTLPRDGDAWRHAVPPAHDLAIWTLVALGRAAEVPDGAPPLRDPACPERPLRWDDLCCVALALAQSERMLDLRPTAGPGIAAGPGSGRAWATPAVLDLLTTLGLVAAGRWTARAEVVLWRHGVAAWGIDPSADPRFAAAVTLAVATVPADLRADITRLARVPDAEVQAALDRHAAWIATQRAQGRPEAQLQGTRTPAQMRQGIARARLAELDRLFRRHWRLPDGWLTAEAAAHALDIDDDPLARAMCRAVVAHLVPESEVVQCEREELR